jgi:hypothetical protein
MRFSRHSFVRSVITVVITGCMGGTGSGLVGISSDTGGGARTLSFAVQPRSADTGNIITPAIQVTALDSASRVDTSFRSGVSVTLLLNTNGATLRGTTSVVAVAGVATFGDLRIDRAGSYALRATTGAAIATSAGFTISIPPRPLTSAP